MLNSVENTECCMDCGAPGGRICSECEQEWLDK